MKNFIYCNSVAAHPCYRKETWFGGPKFFRSYQPLLRYDIKLKLYKKI